MDATRCAVLPAAALLALVLAGCAAQGQIDVVNRSGSDITVTIGDEDLGEIGPEGGAVLLEVADCVDGPVVVGYADGRTAELAGPVCAGQRVTVGASALRLTDVPAS